MPGFRHNLTRLGNVGEDICLVPSVSRPGQNQILGCEATWLTDGSCMEKPPLRKRKAPTYSIRLFTNKRQGSDVVPPGHEIPWRLATLYDRSRQKVHGIDTASYSGVERQRTVPVFKSCRDITDQIIRFLFVLLCTMTRKTGENGHLHRFFTLANAVNS
jgi:hypothetical protein